MLSSTPRRARGTLLVTLALASLFVTVSLAQAGTDAEFLRAKLSFRYVDQPNDTSQAPDILNNSDIAAGRETGRFWSKGNIPGLQKIVRALLKDSGQGGDGNLQFVAAKIIGVLNKPVMVTLINDADATLTSVAFGQWDACNDGSGHAWPCASNMATLDDIRENCARAAGRSVPARRDSWAGQMALGQAVFSGPQASEALGTFIHELVHTQDRSDRRTHMFWLSSKGFHYGSDGTHYRTEAVPNLAATYQEGIANTMRLVVDNNVRAKMFQWFANDDVVMVEKAPPRNTGFGRLPCSTPVTSPSEDIWLYDQLKAAGAREIAQTPPDPGYAYYHIRSLPPKFIVHSEYIIALTFSEYSRHMGLTRFLNALRTNDATIFRVSTSPVAQLYNTLCTAGLNGRALSSVTNVNEAGPKPYLIPLAYADYFTGYRSRTKADYASIFENMLRSEWVDLYWDGYKDEVRSAVPIDASHPPKFENLTDIAIALGVNQSDAP